MNRLEIIHLRLTDGRPEDLVGGILQSATTLESHTDLLIYRRERITTDLSIHLVHRGPAEELPSPFGMRLASALREHGMVEHSVWTESEEGANRE
jgi:hypothetical protein